eukprot:3186201-Prymnesium_polylepis.1
MHSKGVDMSQLGSIYLDQYPHARGEGWCPQFQTLKTSMAPVMVARQMICDDVIDDEDSTQYWYKQCSVAFLEQCVRQPKRERSKKSLEERASRAGVLDRLKPIPASLRQEAQSGSADAKKAVQKIQTANQQVVSRAEQAQKKQC